MTDPTPASSSRRAPALRRRRAAGTVTLAFAVLAALLAACGGGGHQAAPTSTTSPGSTRAVTGPTPGYRWAQATVDRLGGGPSSTIATVLPPAQIGGSWLAVGSTTGAGGGVTATEWTSPDALRWTAASVGVDGTDSQIRGATQWGSRQLAVGSVGMGADQQAAVWVSAGPGQPLQPVTGQSAFTAPSATGPSNRAPATASGAQMDQVAAGALGIFATGTVDGQLAVWYSSDGTTWTRLSGAERVIDAAAHPQINDLLVAANGVWAVGSVGNGTRTNAAVWNSTDGIRWSRVMASQSTFAADGNRVINAIAPLGTGFVAVGGVRSGAAWLPASWISPDGVSWSQASESFPSAPGATTDTTGPTVAAVADDVGVGLVAVGGSPSAQRVWTSVNGLSWTETALPPNAAAATGWHLGIVAASGTTTVVADDTVGDPRLLVDLNGTWHEVTASPGAFGKPAAQAIPASLVSDGGVMYLAVNIRNPGQVLGDDRWSSMVLSSTDGGSWQVDASGNAFSGYQIRSLLAVQTGLLAAGSSVATAGARSQPALWSSSEGLDWRKITTTAARTTGGAQAAGAVTAGGRITALARLGSTVIGLGQSGGGPSSPPGTPLAAPAAAWVEHDGATSWQAVGPVDPDPSVNPETVGGACAGPQSAVGVGATVTGTGGTAAAAWITTDASAWRRATISPSPAAGAEEAMTGCLSTGNGFLAYGTSPGTGGSADPALWQSSDGATWTRQNVVAFAGTGAGPIRDLALQGTTWLATSAPVPPTAAPTATAAACRAALWESTDAGATWTALDTSTAPWQAALDADTDLVGFASSGPVVVGTTDGQLTIWQGQKTAG